LWFHYSNIRLVDHLNILHCRLLVKYNTMKTLLDINMTEH
jgi:hypothetical protein